MRLLFISAFYPPHEIGGWEQLTEEMTNGLRQRGHEVCVLTNRFQAENSEPLPHIQRILWLENDQYKYNLPHFFRTRPQQRQANVNTLKETITTFQPDAVMFHSMWNLDRRLAWWAEQLMPAKVAYYVADYWLTEPDVNQRFWQGQAERGGFWKWGAGLILPALQKDKTKYPLAWEQLVFVSKFVQKTLSEQGITTAEAGQVIYNGIDVDKFRPASIPTKDNTLLYVGSLAPHKGLRTALEAMALVCADEALPTITLKVAGNAHPEAVAHIDQTIADLGIQDQVQLLGYLPREQMPALYQQAKALLFPSRWAEPLARTTQEAMGCGTPVIATPTGGTPELVKDGYNGLLFPVDDAQALAQQIKRLWQSPELAQTLRHHARQTVVERFNIEHTITNLENYFQQLISQ